MYSDSNVTRVGVNSIPELELQLNSNSGIGIGIEISEFEDGIGIEIPGIGIENQNWIFCNCHCSTYQFTNHFQILALTGEVIIFHVADSSCNRFVFQVLGTLAPCGVVTKDYGEDTLFPLSRQSPEGLQIVTITVS